MVEPKVSPNMKKGIKSIETVLKIKYTGKTFDDAKKFLDEYLPQIKGVDMREFSKPSEKMLRGIAFIEEFLKIEYTGKTMKDGSEFIGRYLQEAIKIASNSKKGK